MTRQCGLCGKTERLKKTACCKQWICDDEEKYTAFTYSSESCHRNHRRYTLCAQHHKGRHSGSWQTCQRCREGIEIQEYVWFGTNEHNFEKLKNPPKCEPKKCGNCKKPIDNYGNKLAFMVGVGEVCETCVTQKRGGSVHHVDQATEGASPLCTTQ